MLLKIQKFPHKRNKSVRVNTCKFEVFVSGHFNGLLTKKNNPKLLWFVVNRQFISCSTELGSESG